MILITTAGDARLRDWRVPKARFGAESRHRCAGGPYYLDYRLLDLDVREVVGGLGRCVSMHTAATRHVNVGPPSGGLQRPARIV